MPKLGHFAFDKKIIARGFTSVVYKGIDEITGKKVAIKCIDEAILDEPGKKKMLANELSIQWQLKEQPFIVQIKGQFSQNDSIYIVTEHCEFGDLKNKIKEKGKFVEAKSVSYMIDIIRGFQTLIRHHIVHRDIKPSNIMISKKGIKLGDFGFAYKLTESAEQISIPSAGSPLYMAPQVLEDGKNSSHLSDVWSLGVVFFQMLTGRLPFPAKNKQTLIKLIDKIVIRTIIPQNLSPRSKQFLLRTLKKDPSKRMTPQQIIEYQFDEEILFKIQLHRQRKMQQQQRNKQDGEFSTQSEDRVSPQEKDLNKNEPQGHTHLHHHNPEVEKKITSHHHHQGSKDYEPQKPAINHHQNTVPEELIKKQTSYRILEAAQSSKASSSNDFDSNTHKSKNLLDPHDLRVDRFKRKSSQKMDDIELNTQKTAQQNKKKKITTIQKIVSQNDNKNDNKINEPNNYILHKKPLQGNNYKRTSQLMDKKDTQTHTNKHNNIFYSNEQQGPKGQFSHSEQSRTDLLLKKQQSIHSASELEQNRRISNYNKLYRQDSLSSIDSYHSQHHIEENNHQIKKEQIIEILLNQVDVIRFLSRIMHKIQELHHIHTSEKSHSDRSVSQNPHSKQNHAHQQTVNYPEIYIQLKQLIYKTILQIQKLQFLPDQMAYKFFRSEEFDQIKIILDTYKSKLDLVAVKSIQWKGIRTLEKELEKQILLIYSTITERITKLEQRNLQNDERQLKKLKRKIQALDHLIVFRYDYLILQREEIFLHEPGHKNNHHNEKCSRIKEIIQERHSRHNEGTKNLQQCCNELKKIELVMKKIKLI